MRKVYLSIDGNRVVNGGDNGDFQAFHEEETPGEALVVMDNIEPVLRHNGSQPVIGTDAEGEGFGEGAESYREEFIEPERGTYAQ